MPFTQYGVQALIWKLGSNLGSLFVNHYAIGIGSTVSTIGDVTLANETGVRNIITGSPDFTTARKVTFLGDFNSVQMSGVQLAEFGLFASGATTIGSIWFRSSFNPITFDGTNELSLSTAIEGKAG